MGHIYADFADFITFMVVDPTPPPILIDVPAACWRRSSRRRFERHPQRHLELVVLHGLSGRMRYLIDGRIVILRAGSVLWAFAGQEHVLLSETADFDMWVFLIAPRLLAEGSPAMPPLRVGEVAGPTGPRTLGARESAELEAIAAGIHATDDEDARAEGYRWWLARAWYLWTRAPAQQVTAVHPAVGRAANALQADPDQSLDQLGRMSGLSANRLGRLFKQQTGKSIVRYRGEQKLDRVDRALQDTPKANLLTVALDAGFAGYPQFYRTFRKLRGVSPYDYYRRSDLEGP